MAATQDSRSALRAIAIFAAVVGFAALAGLIGVIDLLHHDVHALAMSMIGRFGLDPEAHYPSLLLHYANELPDVNVPLLVVLVCAFIALRFVEATGLWLGKVWGEYLGALSGGIYIPFEVVHWVREPTWLSAFVVLLNVVIVGYLTHALWQRLQPKVTA
jgi:uncharacterized membrane protein (DUF2068 family)